jgi:flagellar protein FlaG
MDIQSSTGASPLATTLSQRATSSSGTPAAAQAAAAQPAPVQTAIAVTQAAPAPNLAQVSQAVKSLNRAMQEQAQNLEFSIDEDTNRTIVKLIDKSSGEVLRQIPSQEALEIAKALDQISGLLIRQKA